MEDFLRNLGLKGPFNNVDGHIEMDLKDSNEFGRIFSLLDNSQDLYEDDSSSSLDYDHENVQFVNEENGYLITMVGDFNEDTYKLTCKQL